jgi:hypothetical protein
MIREKVVSVAWLTAKKPHIKNGTVIEEYLHSSITNALAVTCY